MQSHKTQTYEITNGGNFITLRIKETNSFRGIPYADYFTVNTEWIVISKCNEVSECSIKVLLDFSFLKSTWLQGTIESNTKAELLTVYELWISSAEEYLLNDIIQIDNDTDDGADYILNSISSSNSYQNQKEHHNQGSLIQMGMQGTNTKVCINSGKGSRDIESSKNEIGIYNINVINTLKDRSSNNDIRRSKESVDENIKNPSIQADYGSDGEDLEFFDCEDVGDMSNSSSHDRYDRNNDNSSYNVFHKKSNFSEKEIEYSYTHVQSQINSNVIENRNNHSSSRSRSRSRSRNEEEDVSSLRDLAVQTVETTFVLAEFTFWKVGQLFYYNLSISSLLTPCSSITFATSWFIC